MFRISNYEDGMDYEAVRDDAKEFVSYRTTVQEGWSIILMEWRKQLKEIVSIIENENGNRKKMAVGKAA
jgi:hypothetical protein